MFCFLAAISRVNRPVGGQVTLPGFASDFVLEIGMTSTKYLGGSTTEDSGA